MQELLRGASVAFALKVLAAGLAFCLNVVLARLLGAEGSGIYFLAFTIVLIIATIGRVGMENALVRFIAANVSAGRPGKVLGVYQKAMRYSLTAAILLSTLLFLFAPLMSQRLFNKPALEQPLAVMALAVVPLALLTLHAYALQGLKKIAASVSVQSIVVPLLTCLIALLFVPAYGIDAAVWGYLLAIVVTLTIGRWLWQRVTSSFNTYPAEFDSKELMASSMPLFGVVLMNMVITWSPMLFLGVWESSENLGIYSAANRTAMLTSFVLVAVNSIAAPQFATLYQQGDMQALGVVARNSAKIMVVLATPVLLLFLLFPEWVLSIFGEEFKQGAVVLMILAIGQFLNVATGSVGQLLSMAGCEKQLRMLFMIVVCVSLFMNFTLIYKFGVLGAAVSSAVSVSAAGLLGVYFAWKYLKVRVFW